jgi:hypothetical protein
MPVELLQTSQGAPALDIGAWSSARRSLEIYVSYGRGDRGPEGVGCEALIGRS